MSYSKFALRSRMGDTKYYLLSMKAKEVIDKVKIPKEIPGWDDLTIDEIYQREINYHRVKTQIVPYLVNNKSHFFGSLIVAVEHFEEDFEPIAEVVKNIPRRYMPDIEDLGFLHFTGDELFLPLDGQHRIQALGFAITGMDEKQKGIPSIKPNTDLAKEDVVVILIPFDKSKVRRIFTRVNRYAKPTTAGQNYVTDDDDIIAVLSRRAANKISGRLVKFKSNTLTKSDGHFTTLSIIYNCNKAILDEKFPKGEINPSILPGEDQQELYWKAIDETWDVLLEEIEIFKDALTNVEEEGDGQRRTLREMNLLMKPVVQECLVGAYLRLTTTRGTNLTPEVACERLNRLPWGITEENLKVWQLVLWTGGVEGKVVTKQRNLAIKMIAYLAGEDIGKADQQNLAEEYKKLFPEDESKGKKLPSPQAYR